MKRTLVYESPITSISGYGEYAREVASYLIKMEDIFDLHFVDSHDGLSQKTLKFNDSDINRIFNKQLTEDIVGDIHIYIKMGTPSEFNKIGKYNIGISAVVESTLCHDSVLHGCNKMDHIIVPSEFNKATLVDSYAHHNISMQPSIDIIPECVHNESGNSTDTNMINKFMDGVDEDFCYLYNGRWNLNQAADRKNVNILIRSFVHAFKDVDDKPALILKTHCKNFSESDYTKIYKSIQSIIQDSHIKTPSIYLLHGNLTRSQLKSLYNHTKIKCGLNMSRGESFGRSVLETILAKKPILISGWSGPLDYLSNNLFHIGGQLIETPEVDGIFIKGGKWFDVDVDKASFKILDVFTETEKYQTEIQEITTSVKQTYNKKSIFNKYKQLIDSYL